MNREQKFEASPIEMPRFILTKGVIGRVLLTSKQVHDCIEEHAVDIDN